MKYCCDLMTKYLNEKEVPLEYNPIFREYSISLSSPSSLLIFSCPWCASHLPKSLRDDFFDILEKDYKIDDGLFEIFDNKALPEEFKSDLWWHKRNL